MVCEVEISFLGVPSWSDNWIVFGEVSLFDHGARSADVVANEESVLLRMSEGSFEKMVQEAPDVAAPFLFAMGKTLTSRIRADNKRFSESVTFARMANAISAEE